MNIQINIMAVPKRLHLAAVIQKQIGGKIFCDKEYRGCWWNARRSWQHNDGQDYVLVIQDDILLCQNFLNHLYETVRIKPNSIICYFVGGCLQTVRKEIDGHWIHAQSVPTAQAVLLPTDLTYDFLSWDIRHLKQDHNSIDDRHMRAWMIANNINCWFTVPDLVDHIGAFDSIVWKNYTPPTHRSINFNFELPLTFDWSKGAENSHLHELKLNNSVWYAKNRL